MEAVCHEEVDRPEMVAEEERESHVKVLLTGTSLLPDYGGPAFSVSRLAMALAEAGAEVGLWASDQSAAVTPLFPAASSVQRIIGTEAEALDRFGETDILHDNGIWLPHNHRLAVLAERHGIPRVVSTRGMLEPWALSHKRLKKKLAWWLYQRRDLKQARCHHHNCRSGSPKRATPWAWSSRRLPFRTASMCQRSGLGAVGSEV